MKFINRLTLPLMTVMALLASTAYYVSANLSSTPVIEMTNNEISEIGKITIESELMTPLRKKLGISGTSNMFSRCPSGVNYYIVGRPTEESPYFTGRVTNYEGCHGSPICTFQLSENEKEIKVCPVDRKWELKGQYMSAANFLDRPEYFASRN